MVFLSIVNNAKFILQVLLGFVQFCHVRPHERNNINLLKVYIKKIFPNSLYSYTLFTNASMLLKNSSINQDSFDFIEFYKFIKFN